MAGKPTILILTPEGKAKLQQEYDHLVNVRRTEVAERMHQAMEFAGDPVDNAEYQDAKDEQALVEVRIRELARILATATILTEDVRREGIVQVGSRVTVQDEENEQEAFTLVGSTEATPFQGRYSLDSPVGRALLGHAVGETVLVAAPDGDIRYTIVKVELRPRG
jgi:transcription elongation factor GreA